MQVSELLEKGYEIASLSSNEQSTLLTIVAEKIKKGRHIKETMVLSVSKMDSNIYSALITGIKGGKINITAQSAQ